MLRKVIRSQHVAPADGETVGSWMNSDDGGYSPFVTVRVGLGATVGDII